jgi:antitoxin component YwqK of YwqJK toxin-antitoxin module
MLYLDLHQNYKTMANKVKKLCIYRINNPEGLSAEQIAEKEMLFQKSEYDDNENLINEITYTRDGDIEHEYRYTYDSQNRIIEEILVEGSGEILDRVTKEYDEKGRICREINHYEDDLADITTIEYTAEGKEISRITADSDNELLRKKLHKIEAGKLVAIVETDEEGAVINERTITYNEQGLPEEENVREGDVKFRLVSIYNEKGQRILIKKYNQKNELLERVSYSYDDAGHIIEMKEEDAGGIEIHSMQIDAFENVIKQETTNPSGVITGVIEREFDAENRQLFTYVDVKRRNQSFPQNYRLRYDYEYWG